jgi:FkbM family methyltransferase
VPAVERFLKLGIVERVVSAFLRGGAVQERTRFALNEIVGAHGLRRYRLRDSGLVVHVRHSSPDVLNFDEIFYQRLYEIPEPVRRAIEMRGNQPRILDLGANVGLAGAWFLGAFPGSSVVGYEPDPENAEVHAKTVGTNELNGRWELRQSAASDRTRKARFVPGHFAESHLAAAGEEGIDVEAVDILPELQRAELVKMDIEGGEWAILGDERFSAGSAAAVVLEYHPHLCPELRPDEYAKRLLADAGYEVHEIFRAPEGHGMVWAWRP